MDNLRRIIAEEINNYGFDKYTKHEIKVQQIINSNEFASKLELIRKHAQARVDRLTDKVRDIRRMADTLLEKGRKVGY
jgi:TATA-box binding protein (TBP) (component of TFIID and TFIIIB)